MTNSKKNSKSIIALIVMSLLLVASIILAATGAYFTAKDSANASADVVFGKVAVSLKATGDGENAKKITLTKCTEDTLVTDKCSWDITNIELVNDSTVDIYYAYSVKVEVVEVVDGSTEKAVEGAEATYFTITNDNSNNTATKAILVEAGQDLATINNCSVVFDSKGAMNGSEKTYKIKVTVEVKAIQAAHVASAEEAATKLASYDTINNA